MTDASAEARFLIKKGGAYYRPNARGYTTSVIQAGRYTKEEAYKHSHPNGPDGPRDNMSFIHEDDITNDEDWNAYRALAAERDALSARVNELQAPRRVKALEWKLIEPHRGPHYWRAKTPFGEYDAGWSVEAWAQCIGPSMWEWSSSKDHRFLTEDDAKAACQADYERRLTSCYEATPEDATAKAVAERWEQMEGAINTLLNIWLDNGEVRDLRNSDLADFHATMKSIETARREAAIRAGEGE